MTHHSLDLDLASALAAPRDCPACRSADLLPVCDDQGVVFLCHGCSRTWLVELGTLVVADPADRPDAPAVPGPRSRSTR